MSYCYLQYKCSFSVAEFLTEIDYLLLCLLQLCQHLKMNAPLIPVRFESVQSTRNNLQIQGILMQFKLRSVISDKPTYLV